MNTPICDFVRQYAAGNPVRLHMPGHKGKPFTGPEPLDITEIPGADVLYHAEGIIRESEENAAWLFGSGRTLYSAEGSSLCIRAMLYLAQLHARQTGCRPLIAAGRNAHKVFLTAAALLDLDILWLFSEEAGQDVISCRITPASLDRSLAAAAEKPAAVYLTSPDYLGNCADLASLAEVCHRHGALLLVDNAHGAYLRFLTPSRHPMDLGADLCCDSAHKTLPVLTGGAYLHLSRHASPLLQDAAEQAMQLFASTSPSYLILQSLDAVNPYLEGAYPAKLAATAARVETLRRMLTENGWQTVGDECLKLTLAPKGRGYTGAEIAEILEKKGIFCEFADPDYVVMMFTPATEATAFDALLSALEAIPPRAPNTAAPPPLGRPERALSPREALLAPFETVPLSESVGRVLASPSVSCPPAVPVVVCGERIDERAAALLAYYGFSTCRVVRDSGGTGRVNL
jgi:arginine/lysine/ornithine decarboxylase